METFLTLLYTLMAMVYTVMVHFVYKFIHVISILLFYDTNAQFRRAISFHDCFS